MVKVSFLPEASGRQAFDKTTGPGWGGSSGKMEGERGRRLQISAFCGRAAHVEAMRQLSGLRRGSLCFQWADIIR